MNEPNRFIPMRTARFLVDLLLAPSLAVWAQPLTLTVSAPTTSSVYAQQRIDLLSGFVATTGGFEAKIKLPEATAGRWSVPLLWTPYQRNNNGITGMVGIHTHVLPTGDVLSWEGHNINTLANPSLHTSHAYVWNSNPRAQITWQFGYPNIYTHTPTTTTATSSVVVTPSCQTVNYWWLADIIQMVWSIEPLA